MSVSVALRPTPTTSTWGTVVIENELCARGGGRRRREGLMGQCKEEWRESSAREDWARGRLRRNRGKLPWRPRRRTSQKGRARVQLHRRIGGHRGGLRRNRRRDRSEYIHAGPLRANACLPVA